MRVGSIGLEPLATAREHATPARRIKLEVLPRLRQGLLRLLRLNATPHGVALGFTLGLGLSLFPIPFLGMVVALAVAPLVGASLPAVYAGSAVVNPLTGPGIYFGELWLGGQLTGAELPAWLEAREYDWREWMQLFGDLLPVFLLGAVTAMVLCSVVAYPSIWWLVSAYRRRHPSPSAESDAEGSMGSSRATGPHEGPSR